MKTFTSILYLCILFSASTISADDKAQLQMLQQRNNQLEAGVHGAEAIRAVKRLQYAYGHYAELGLWHDLADLFADNGVGHYPAGNLGNEAIRKLFLNDVGKGMVGLGEGVFYPHIMLQPVVHVARDGQSAQIRMRLLQLAGPSGGNGSWIAGSYEGRTAIEDGAWKFTSMNRNYLWTADYKGGWAHINDKAKGVVEAPFPKIVEPPFHYKNPVTGRKPPVLLPER